MEVVDTVLLLFQYLRQAIQMRSDYTEAYINRGDILMKLNKSKEAEETYLIALNFDQDNADIHYNVRTLYMYLILLAHQKKE